VVCVALCGACANRLNEPIPVAKDAGPDGSSGGSGAGQGGGGNGGNTLDAAVVPLDATPSLDAFFINDPPPPYCALDGAVGMAVNPGGTPTCPDDKNREGCPCTKAGQTAACWPGKRVNREHGVCKDGTATCVATQEFGLLWGACKGYVLPTAGAIAGPDACRCFSSGTWALTNLAPCLYTTNNNTYLYSSHLDSAGKIACNTVSSVPPGKPAEDWNSSTLKLDCAGKFTLCYTIKAGDVKNPQPADCVLNKQCLDVAYDTIQAEQKLPNLPGWTSGDKDCGNKFVSVGGYGEMSVEGQSVECDKVDDGKGNPYIFLRTAYCPPRCTDTPNTAECKACSTGGSGTF
jgi:hypothetical protein